VDEDDTTAPQGAGDDGRVDDDGFSFPVEHYHHHYQQQQFQAADGWPTTAEDDSLVFSWATVASTPTPPTSFDTCEIYLE
jgi:hypothetical protein